MLCFHFCPSCLKLINLFTSVIWNFRFSYNGRTSTLTISNQIIKNPVINSCLITTTLFYTICSSHNCVGHIHHILNWTTFNIICTFIFLPNPCCNRIPTRYQCKELSCCCCLTKFSNETIYKISFIMVKFLKRHNLLYCPT